MLIWGSWRLPLSLCGGWGGVCTVIFVSNPTTILGLYCVVIGFGTKMFLKIGCWQVFIMTWLCQCVRWVNTWRLGQESCEELQTCPKKCSKCIQITSKWSPMVSSAGPGNSAGNISRGKLECSLILITGIVLSRKVSIISHIEVGTSFTVGTMFEVSNHIVVGGEPIPM